MVKVVKVIICLMAKKNSSQKSEKSQKGCRCSTLSSQNYGCLIQQQQQQRVRQLENSIQSTFQKNNTRRSCTNQNVDQYKVIVNLFCRFYKKRGRNKRDQRGACTEKTSIERRGVVYRSSKMALPMPPPTQSVARPRLTSRRCIS